MDLVHENSYHTPYTNSSILPLLLLSLMKQRISPKTSSSFKDEYDFIIVGAGSAGSVVASRLSEIPCVSVLLLEAGKTPPVLTEIPGIARYFWNSDLDWQYKTVPQKHCGAALVNNQLTWPSGKAIGGTSIINAMCYVRGNRYNYDNWTLHGAVGWSASDTKPYFLKMEDNRDREYLADGYHVVDGPITVQRPAYNPKFKKGINAAVEQMGYKIGDSNARKQTGFYDMQGTTRNGQRCSTAKAYLVPAENRTNLHIVPNAFVRKVIIKNLHATGVRFDHGGKTHEVRARKEVIMSAGTVNSAQLLMLSGIGPRKHLKKLNIPVVADHPVGENFQDHPSTILPFTLDPNIPKIEQKLKDLKNIQEYIQNRTGPLSSLEGITSIAFLNEQLRPKVDFPSYELYFAEIPLLIPKSQLGIKPEIFKHIFAPYMNSTLYACAVQLLQVKSVGTVRLNSTDPYDPPLIDPNYYADPRDIQAIVKGMKTCLAIAASAPMKKIGAKAFTTVLPDCLKFAKKPDLFLECFARSVVMTLSHQVGTVKMGDPRDPTTVVDPELRVKGIKGLRVVDASIIPIIPSGNTNAPTIMVAEKASDMIKSTLICNTQTPV